MTSFDSTQYTVGKSLDLALAQGNRVSVLVDGHWLEGHVLASDSFGVVIAESYEAANHAVAKLEAITAVKIEAAPPVRRPVYAAIPGEQMLENAGVPDPRGSTE